MSISQPFFTIYIVSKNYAHYLDQSIRSVIDQSLTDWELFLFDNGSSDNSYNIMLKYDGIENVSCIKSDDWKIAKIANYVISNSRGKFIMRLDADDFLDPRALEIFFIELRRNPDLTMIYPDYFLVNEDGRVLSLEYRESSPSIDSYKSIPPHGACAIWQIDLLRQIGGYDENFSAQDGLDVWLKANELKSGFRYMNLNLPLFSYRRHNSNLTSKSDRIRTARQSIKSRYRNSASIKTLAIIPCRSRFDFLPNAWSLEIEQDRSLLEKCVIDLIASDYVDEILITGDTEELQTTAKYLASKYTGKMINFFYRKSLHDLTSPNLFSLLKSVNELPEFVDFEVFVIKFPLAPFVDSSLVDELVDTMQLEDSDSSCLISRIHGTVLKRGRFGVDLQSIPGNINHFYDSFFRHTNSLFVMNVSNLRLNSLWGRSISYVESEELIDFVIDSKTKLKIAQSLHK